MNTIKVTVTEVAKHFSEYVNRVNYRGEHFILLKGKKEVAEISPVPKGRVLGELPGLLSKIPDLPNDEMDAFADDMKKIRKMINAERLRDPWES